MAISVWRCRWLSSTLQEKKKPVIRSQNSINSWVCPQDQARELQQFLNLPQDQAALERSSSPKNPYIRPMSCSVLCCFSLKQRQTPSCVFPKNYFVLGLLGGMTLVFLLPEYLSSQRCNTYSIYKFHMNFQTEIKIKSKIIFEIWKHLTRVIQYLMSHLKASTICLSPPFLSPLPPFVSLTFICTVPICIA